MFGSPLSNPATANVLPDGVAFDSAGNYYIADIAHNLIRKVTVGASVPGLSVTASSLFFSYAGGNQPNARIVTAFTTGPVPLGFQISSSTSTGGGWLNVALKSGNTPTQITVAINTPPPVGTYQGTVVLTPAAASLPVVNIPVTLKVLATAPARPLIPAGGVVNGASFAPSVAANSLATIQGSNLASVTDNWNSSLASGQLPTSPDGVTVLFNGMPAYLTYISPTQINLIVPDISAGTTPVVLTNNGTSPTGLFTTSVSLYGPAFFTWGAQAVATRQDYSYAVKNGTFPGLNTAAAQPGDVLILWGTGFGPATPAAPPGIPVRSDKIYSTSTAPTISINNVTAMVYGSALAPGYAGLYQVAIQVPTSLADGDWPIVASIGGVQSPSGVILSVHH